MIQPTRLDWLLDVLSDLREEITLCPFCQKILLNDYIKQHVKRYHDKGAEQ